MIESHLKASINKGYMLYVYFSYRGESYAGIYVPTLVNTVMKMNEQQSEDKQINLKGFAVSTFVVITLRLPSIILDLFDFFFLIGWQWLHWKQCRRLWRS